MSFINGQTLKERYRIENRINAGGFGAIYTCTDLISGDKCLLKTVNVFPGTPDFFFQNEHVQTEIDILQELGKIDSCTVYLDSFVIEDRNCLVVEYIEGKSLYDLIQSGQFDFSLTTIESMFRKMVEIIDVLHDKAIVHGDLNPKNIIVTPGGSPVLIDFGIAQTGITDGTQKRIGELIQFRGFTAPETVKRGEYSWAADTFGLGMLLYYMITQRIPEKDSYSVNPADHAQNIPRTLRNTVIACTKYNPKHRPINRDEIQNLLAGSGMSESGFSIQDFAYTALHATNSKIILCTNDGTLQVRDFLSNDVIFSHQNSGMSGETLLDGTDRFIGACYPETGKFLVFVKKFAGNSAPKDHYDVITLPLSEELIKDMVTIRCDVHNGTPMVVCITHSGVIVTCRLIKQRIPKIDLLSLAIPDREKVKNASIGLQGVVILTGNDRLFIQPWYPMVDTNQNLDSDRKIIVCFKHALRELKWHNKRELPTAIYLVDDRLIVGTESGNIYYYGKDSRTKQKLKSVHKTALSAINGLGYLVVSADENNNIVLWELNQLEPITYLHVPTRNVQTVDIGGRCIGVLGERSIYLYDLVIPPRRHQMLQWLKTLKFVNEPQFETLNGSSLTHQLLDPFVINEKDEFKESIPISTIVANMIEAVKNPIYLGQSGCALAMPFIGDLNFQRNFKAGIREKPDQFWAVLNGIYPSGEINENWSFSVKLCDFTEEDPAEYQWSGKKEPIAVLSDRYETSISVIIELEGLSAWFLPLIDSISLTIESDRGDIQEVLFNRLYYVDGKIMDQASFKLDSGYNVERYAYLEIIDIDVNYADRLIPNGDSDADLDIKRYIDSKFDEIKSEIGEMLEDSRRSLSEREESINSDSSFPPSGGQGSPFPSPSPSSSSKESPFPPLRSNALSSDDDGYHCPECGEEVGFGESICPACSADVTGLWDGSLSKTPPSEDSPFPPPSSSGSPFSPSNSGGSPFPPNSGGSPFPPTGGSSPFPPLGNEPPKDEYDYTKRMPDGNIETSSDGTVRISPKSSAPQSDETVRLAPTPTSFASDETVRLSPGSSMPSSDETVRLAPAPTDFASDETVRLAPAPTESASDETVRLSASPGSAEFKKYESAPFASSSVFKSLKSAGIAVLSESDSQVRMSDASVRIVTDPQLETVRTVFNTPVKKKSGKVIHKELFNNFVRSYKAPRINPIRVQIGTKMSIFSKMIDVMTPKLVLLSYIPTLISWILVLYGGTLETDSGEFMIQAIGYGILAISVFMVFLTSINLSPEYKKRKLTTKEE